MERNVPVLVEPVVSLGLGVEGVAKVGGTGGSNPVHRAVSDREVVDQLLVSTFVVLLHDTKVTSRGSYDNKNGV